MNFDFSGDEFLFFGFTAIVSLIAAIFWISMLVRISRFVLPMRLRVPFLLAPVPGLLIVYVVLQTASDPQVRAHGDYVLLFMFGAILWLAVSGALFPWLGMSITDDAVQHANPAAVTVTIGAMTATLIAYAGCNIGAGPTIWTTLVPAAIATASLLLSWLIYVLASGANEAIAIDRDVASGMRFAALLVALGVIFGRAMAGDFTSWSQTFADFLMFSWPALVLLIVATVTQRFLRPTPQNPRPQWMLAGAIPGMFFLVTAIVYLIVMGVPQ